MTSPPAIVNQHETYNSYLWGIKLLKENAIQITGKVDYWRIPSSVHEAAINLNPINNNDINLN